MKLTQKQEKFAQLYVELGNASEAYRQAYPGSEKWKDNTIWPRSSNLLNSSKVHARVEQIQAEAKERNAVTVDSILAELEEARVAALGAKFPQSSAAVSASVAKARLCGLIVDKQERKVTSKIKGQITLADLLSGDDDDDDTDD